ncbi:MAG: putative ABC transporter permease [Eubacterium sp.]|nr:putative ABC transporter permease [Eubacterium sp.]
MNKLLILLFLFSSGSITGWVIELFFRRYLDPVERKKKKWVNPGFLVGPYLPIYGAGLIVLYLLGHIRIPSLGVTHPILEKLIIFVIMAACMTLLEFITGMIFINHLHLQLWDYSSYWGNIKGVICPLFSLIWYALAAFYYLILHPQVLDALYWLSKNLAFSFFIGFFYGIFALDIVYSAQLLVKIKALADEYQIIVKYNAYKSKLIDIREEAKERSYFFFSSRLSSISPHEVFEKYRDNFSVKNIVMTPINQVKKVTDKVQSVSDNRNK